MVVTAQSGWREQTLTKEKFRASAFAWWPAHVLNELDPDEAYDICVHYNVDANLVINIFRHESSSGRAGVALETHSAGNTREPTFGRVPKKVASSIQQSSYRAVSGLKEAVYHISEHGVAAGRSGYFAKFASWKDGWESTVARLASPIWVYHKMTTIYDVIHTWAPGHDMNDPNGYTQDVVRGMNTNIERAVSVPPTKKLIDLYTHIPTIDRSQILSAEHIAKAPNFPHERLRQFKYITVHETGNPNPGTGAQNHRDFVFNGGGANNVSYQWTVDDKVIIQITDVMVACWHAGDQGGAGNYESNGIEICINSDGDYNRALYNTAYLIATLQRDYGITMQNKRRHQQWSGKNCPAYLINRNLWGWFIQGVEDWRAKLDKPSEPRKKTFPNGKSLHAGFLEFYEQAESAKVHWQTIGMPIGDEIADVPVDDEPKATVQQTDVGWLLWKPNRNEIRMATRTQQAQIHKHLGLDKPVVDAALIRAEVLNMRGALDRIGKALPVPEDE